MSESQVSKDSKNQDSKNRESKNQQLEERKRGEQELEERKRGGEGGSEGEFGTKCAKCMDPCVKIALITFPIFLIASILIGILGLSSQASKNNNSTDPSSPVLSSSVLSSSVPVRNVTRFKVPTSTSTIFRSDIIHTAPAGSNGDEDTHFYSILFLVLALTSLIVIFCGKYWTIGLYNPPPDTIDRDTDRSFAQSQPIAGNRVLLEEQITTV